MTIPPATDTAPERASGLLEREAALSRLSGILSAASRGAGHIAVVTGEAGIGKTSLVRAFTEACADTARVLWGGCDPLSTPRALGPLHDIADALSPAVNDTLAAGAAPDHLFPMVLRSLADGPTPTVVVFEDIHWADGATLDLIRYIGRRITRLPVLLILTFRDETDTSRPISLVVGELPQDGVVRLPLAPLSPAAVERLARRHGQDAGDLHRITQGNPFFLTEVLANPDLTDGQVPPSVRDAVWSRCARAGAAEREIIDLMSVCPGALSRELLTKCLGVEAVFGIAGCLASGIIVEDEAGLRFRHELARQAAMSRLSPAAQRAQHALISDALSDTALAGDAGLSRRLHHAAGAGDAEAVLCIAPLAASRAAMLGAHQQAADHLASALRYSETASPETAARLHEDWAYEAGLSQRIDDAVIFARHRAIALWRQLGRIDKVGHNLRWLSRLHWYRGEADLAASFADQAVRVLETDRPGPELAMAYSVRSQLHMLNDRVDEAVQWGERALRLARVPEDVEIRIHALNNIGTALLFADRPGGRERLEESLALALAHGFHEHAARVYTNLSEYAVVFKDFALAEVILAEGLAFDTRHDLDSWTHYLVGWKAQLCLDQGRLLQAETIARGVIGMERLTLVMRLPARLVMALAVTRSRGAEGHALLNQTLVDALATGEPQRVAPVRLGLIEAHWLSGNLDAALEQICAFADMPWASFDPWTRGALAVWQARLIGPDGPLPIESAGLPLPRSAELRGEPGLAADAWEHLGLPYEAALSLSQTRGPEAAAAFTRALTLFDERGALPAAARLRAVAKRLGVALPGARRGPYSAARRHPLDLTRREQEVLRLLAAGASNKAMADTLFRSPRTIEHHVSAVLEKLGATSRVEAVLRLHKQPWILGDGTQADAAHRP